MLRQSMTRRGPRATAALAVLLGILLGSPAGAPLVPRAVLKSFFIEGAGKTASQPRVADTELLLTYVGGLAGTSSGPNTTSALYLYDQAGEPLTSGTGEVVCAPCLFQNGDGSSAPRRLSIALDDL